MNTTKVGRWKVSPISFKVEDGNGQGNYLKGLKPDCLVKDDFEHALGDQHDVILRTALSYMQNMVCPQDNLGR
jgi:hypothetical protein